MAGRYKYDTSLELEAIGWIDQRDEFSMIEGLGVLGCR